MTIPKLLALTAFSLSLASCGGGNNPPKPAESKPAPVAIDQDNVCVVLSTSDAPKSCKDGEKVIFTPQSWGNEQLPILFAGFSCDLRYAVALTNGGVACIYKAPIAFLDSLKNNTKK